VCHLEEHSSLLEGMRVFLDLVDSRVILIPRFLHRLVPLLLVLLYLLKLRIHKLKGLLCLLVISHFRLAPLHSILISLNVLLVHFYKAKPGSLLVLLLFLLLSGLHLREV